MTDYCIHENPGKPCEDVRCDYCPFRFSVDCTATTDDYVAKQPLYTCPHGTPNGVECSACWEGFPDHLALPPSYDAEGIARKAQETELDRNVFENPGRQTHILEGSDFSALPVNSRGEIDEHDVALFLTDELVNPYHYARWAEEPIQFIAINDLPWWLANVIKYTMRFDAKEGLKDLYKARTYLEMKIRQLEGVERFWVKPVAEERKLNDPSAQIARKG